MTPSSSTSGLTCSAMGQCFSAGRQQKLRRQSCDSEGEIIAFCSLMSSFKNLRLCKICLFAEGMIR